MHELGIFRGFSGPESGWAMKMGQWPMSYSFACKNQDFDGLFEILMDHLEKKMAQETLISTLQQNEHQI